MKKKVEVGIRNAEVGPVVVPNERDYVAVYMGKLEFGMRKSECGSRKREVGKGKSEFGKGRFEFGMGNAACDELSRIEVGK